MYIRHVINSTCHTCRCAAESRSINRNAFPFSPCLHRPALIDHQLSFSFSAAAANPSSDNTVKRFGRCVALENKRRKRNERRRMRRVELLELHRRRALWNVEMHTGVKQTTNKGTALGTASGVEKDNENCVVPHPAPKRLSSKRRQRPRAHSLSEGSPKHTGGPQTVTRSHGSETRRRCRCRLARRPIQTA